MIPLSPGMIAACRSRPPQQYPQPKPLQTQPKPLQTQPKPPKLPLQPAHRSALAITAKEQTEQKAKQILVITPFKVGSSSLCSLLVKKYDYTLEWYDDMKNYYSYLNNKIILRGHTFGGNLTFTASHFDIWFTIIRKPSDIYISGYFQDIDHSKYPYYVGTREEVLDTDHTILLNHFLQYKWSVFNQFSYDYNFNIILKYTGVDIWNMPFNKDKGYTIYQNHTGGMKVVVLTLDVLHNNINAVFNDLHITTKKKCVIPPQNVGENKWYSKPYAGVKKLLPESYYKMYSDVDKKICDKFLSKT